jgi:hypothetical protein
VKLLQLALVAALLAWAWAWHQTRTLPELGRIHSELLQEPAQRATGRAPFGFEYRGLAYEVKPVASYDLYGLVVSHNDIHGIADIYHDDDSVDTKDLCVIWGPNLQDDGYRKASYESTPTWCWVQWGEGVSFDLHAMANNHLVTDREDLRAALGRVHVGDQVHFTGMLVNYRDMRHPEFWRPSSTTRRDSGAGACEVVFFEEFEVLEPHAVGAWRLRRVLPWLVGSVLAAMLVVAATTTKKYSEVRV